jgi:hypothetical protein
VWLDPLLILLLLAALAVGIVAVVRQLRSGARDARALTGPTAIGETGADKRQKGVQA